MPCETATAPAQFAVAAPVEETKRQSLRKSLFFSAMRERSIARHTSAISSFESERNPACFSL